MTRGGPVVHVASAHAKINLGLAITGVRPDGYHELASVFLRLALADTLAVTIAGPGRPDALTVDDPACPVEDNLVLKALRALRTAIGDPDRAELPGLLVSLGKRIPMGGGLAGGSTDAAAILRLAPVAWGLAPVAGDLLPLAARLGADVPFFVGGHAAALVTGIGEELAPLPPLRSRAGVLLVTPPFGMATPAVFRAYDRLGPGTDGAATAVTDLVEAWGGGLDGPGLAGHASRLRDANDLWAAAAGLDERLPALRDALETRLDRPVLLTGSGSTLVALYPSPEAARDAARDIAADPALAGARVTATADEPPPDEDPTA
ncbi:MAG: 4-(cytidine 5'-diphospho)-2-C-methyl-D-erythritol kinase [Chloroflexota bacterium]